MKVAFGVVMAWALSLGSVYALPEIMQPLPRSPEEARSHFSTPLPAPSAEALAVAEILELRDAPWTQTPQPIDFLNAYPDGTLSRRTLAGRVVLDCLVQSDGKVACGVAEEEPAGQNLGDAALLMATRYRMARTDSQNRSTTGRRVRPVISISINQPPGMAATASPAASALTEKPAP